MTCLLPAYLLVNFLLTIALSSGCPDACFCKWRNGKQTVDCLNTGLLTIPEGIDPATQVLDAAGSNLQIIQPDYFSNLGLINLQKLFLRQCNIKAIHNDGFKGLTNLVDIELATNQLQRVPTEAFLNSPSLMRIVLRNNPITAIERLAFNHLSFLSTLDLSECQITYVDEEAFSTLYTLEWLDLSKNKIQTFPDMHHFPKALKGLQIHENPFNCDCKIRSFKQWLDRRIYPILVAPQCEKPDTLNGKLISTLKESDLACSPEAAPNSFYFEMEEGRNITFLCKVKSVPPASISWIFRGQVLQNNSESSAGLRFVYFTEEGEEEKQSSLFIYNLNSANNGTFYCLAENPAGAASANYTIMIILKQEPIRLEEGQAFSIDVASIFVAAGLVLASLCFVAIIMALCKRQSKSKEKRKPEQIVANVQVPTLKKSVLKKPPLQPAVAEPDIINEISGEANQYSNKLQLHPIIVTPIAIGNNGRNQPYLKPTLTGKHRPVSAPSFERYVEYFDLRSTSGGYTAQTGNPAVVSALRQTSYSEQSSSKRGKNPMIFVKEAFGAELKNYSDSHEDVQL
ncbi:hypothetical protein HUJ04_011607 [Dendroctonus ponderosae]|uniref:Ig-like domain-containing protein n=1 Tax=Dendroctonus ponderosae TaxID=77166 RepID=A0AAR5PY12_DENPD|nr:hypothetical protein HUJ04_011607 [Dendroctonus ponderosae]